MGWKKRRGEGKGKGVFDGGVSVCDVLFVWTEQVPSTGVYEM
jgi:hypothetical protein